MATFSLWLLEPIIIKCHYIVKFSQKSGTSTGYAYGEESRVWCVCMRVVVRHLLKASTCYWPSSYPQNYSSATVNSLEPFSPPTQPHYLSPHHTCGCGCVSYGSGWSCIGLHLRSLLLQDELLLDRSLRLTHTDTHTHTTYQPPGSTLHTLSPVLPPQAVDPLSFSVFLPVFHTTR